MKPLFIAVLGIASIALSQAATTSFSNIVGFDNTTNPITSSTGVAIAAGTGFVAVGFFNNLSDLAISTTVDASALASDFVVFNSGAFNGPSGLAGLYSYGTSSSGNTAFNGEFVYTVIGNGATLATSTEILIAKHSTQFAADPTITPAAVLSQSGTGNVTTLLKGSFGNFTHDFGVGPVSAYSLAVLIPEPSTALLGAIGALGLLRRRR